MNAEITSEKKRSESIRKKREKARIDIAQKATTVFVQKGYLNTTIHDLEEITGLKAGSIYNLFADKEDILKEAVMITYSAAFEYSATQVPSETDPVTSMAFPVAIELFGASSNPTFAELLDESHHFRSIVDAVIKMKTDWVGQFLKNNGIKIPTQIVEYNMLVFVSAIGGFISEYRYNPHKYYRRELTTLMEIFCTLFQLTDITVDRVVDETIKKLGDGDFNPLMYNIKITSEELLNESDYQNLDEE